MFGCARIGRELYWQMLHTLTFWPANPSQSMAIHTEMRGHSESHQVQHMLHTCNYMYNLSQTSHGHPRGGPVPVYQPAACAWRAYACLFQWFAFHSHHSLLQFLLISILLIMSQGRDICSFIQSLYHKMAVIKNQIQWFRIFIFLGNKINDQRAFQVANFQCSHRCSRTTCELVFALKSEGLSMWSRANS